MACLVAWREKIGPICELTITPCGGFHSGSRTRSCTGYFSSGPQTVEAGRLEQFEGLEYRRLVEMPPGARHLIADSEEIPAHPMVADAGEDSFEAPVGQLIGGLRPGSYRLGLDLDRPGRRLQSLEFLDRQLGQFRRSHRGFKRRLLERNPLASKWNSLPTCL